MRTHNAVRSEEGLLRRVKKDLDRTLKKSVKIVAGHFPLVYQNGNPGNRKATADLNRWGGFSRHSFKLGCNIGSYASHKGMNVGFLVVADDMVEIPLDGRRRKIKNWMKAAQKNYYSGDPLPKEHQRVLGDHNLRDNLILQERSFGNSEVISEFNLKVKGAARDGNSQNECSISYNSMLDDPTLFDPDKDYLVSFMPGQCKGNICEGVLNIRKDIDASHLFFPHIETLGGIVDTNSGFIKVTDAMDISEAYSDGLITYRRDTPL